MIELLIQSSPPLLLASLAGLISELSGSLAIFIEGFINLGAFIAFTGASYSGSWFVGSLLAMIFAGLCGYLLAYLAKTSGANPFILGIALNLGSGVICRALSLLIFKSSGVLSNPALAEKLTQSPVRTLYSVTAFLLVPILTYILYRSRWGLRLRASGVSIEQTLEHGINPWRYKIQAWAFCAALAALAGAALSARTATFVPGGAAGRGWLALAAVYMGFKNPLGVFAAALVLTLAELAGNQFQGVFEGSATLLLAFAPALTLILYVIFSGIRKNKEHL